MATRVFPPRGWILAAMILAAAASRLIPHPPNFTPIGALALFGAACFSNRILGFAVPLAALFVSDLVLGVHPGMPVIYAAFTVYAALGLWLRKRPNPELIYWTTLVGSIQFFIVTNFAVWAMDAGHAYSKTWEGLIACYTAAIPFFGGTVGGDLTYAVVLFGGLALVDMAFPALRQPAPQPA